MRWTMRDLPMPGCAVGPCAWRGSMLLEHAAYVRTHPSLIVIGPDDGDELLEHIGGTVGQMPVLLGVREPAFARQLRGLIERRLATLGRDRVSAVVMWCDEAVDLKGGHMPATLQALRDAGTIQAYGLAHDDPLAIEWIVQNVGARIAVTRYGLHEQTARYRALPTAEEYGYLCMAMLERSDEASLRFALAESARALPILDCPLPQGFEPMSPHEVAQAWGRWRETHEEPPPLPRSRPPMG